MQTTTSVDCSQAATSADIALFKIDNPGALGAFVPAKVAGVPGVPYCGPTFSGTVVGYGPTVFNGAPSGDPTANFVSGWQRVVMGDPTTTWNRNFQFDVPPTYRANLPGDSGGGLFFGNDPASPKVCGIASTMSNGAPPTVSRYASVDATRTAVFIDNIVNSFGRTTPCEPPAGDLDDDNDGVKNTCDNCRYAKNADQLDVDGDTIGDVCDNCIFVKNAGQTDSNIEAETWAAGSFAAPKLPPCGRKNTGCTGEPASPTELQDKYPGDSCDPSPLTSLAQNDGPRFDDGSHGTVNVNFVPGPWCSGSPTTGTVPRPNNNVFTAIERTGASADQTASTRVLACDCPSDKTLAQCRALSGMVAFKCDQNELSLNDPFRTGVNWRVGGMPWFKQDPTTGSFAAANADPPTNRLVSTAHPAGTKSSEPSGTTLNSYSPKRETLGLKYWQSFAYTAPTAPDQEVAAGLIWTWASSQTGATTGWGLPGSTTGPTAAPIMKQLTTRAVFNELVENQTVWGSICMPLIAIDHRTPPLPILSDAIAELISIGRPPNGGPVEVFSVAPGKKPQNVTALLDSSLRSALANASWNYVAASDAHGSWTGDVGAAMISPDHVVRNAVRHLPTGLGYVAVNGNAAAPSTGQSTAAVAAFSGTHQRLAFFGERSLEGVATNTLRFYDFKTDTRSVIQLHDLAGMLAQQPVANSDFESNTLVSWSTSGSVSLLADPRQTSAYVARVGSTEPTLDNTMSQTVVVPTDGRSVLSFAYQVVCPDIIDYDQVEVTATDVDTQAVIQILPQTCTNDGQWRTAETDLALHAGHSVTLTFRVHDDLYPTDPSFAYFDDIRFHTPVTNGGFEAGNLAGWSATGPVALVSAADAADGSYAVRVGSTVATNVDGMLRHTFNVPADANALDFKYKLVCPDLVQYDWMRVELRDNVTQLEYTILDRTCTNTGAWSSLKYAVPSAARGHNVTLTVKVHDDNYPADPTYALVDTVTLSTGVAFTDPVAATYRFEDDAYYVLDRATGASNAAVMRLLRVSSENILQKIAEWPRANAATNFGLTTGEDGSLIVSAWSTSSWTITEFAVPSYGVELIAQHRGTGALASPAWKQQLSGLIAFRSANGIPLDAERLGDLVDRSIKNGGFDRNTLESWSIAGTATTSLAAGGGQPRAQLGSVGGAATSSISQTFTVPPNGIPATAQTLAFTYNGRCPSQSQGSLFASVFDLVTNTTATVLPATCVSSGDWSTVRYSLTASAGHAVTLTITNADGGAGGSHAYAYVDNIHLELNPTLMNTVF